MNDIKILFSHDQIDKEVRKIAQEIAHDYEGQEFVMICVLSGAYIFASDLSKEIWRSGHEKFVTDFVKIKSYGTEKKSSGKVILTKDIETDITNMNVVIIEDIIESGRTLKFLVDYLQKKNPKSIKICSLLSKPLREVEIEPDYLGFTVDASYWVEGYGLDTAYFGRGRPDLIVRG